jgi:hypothetical protein
MATGMLAYQQTYFRLRGITLVRTLTSELMEKEGSFSITNGFRIRIRT